MYQPYDRIQTIDNALGMVKYVGQLPEWGDKVVALGIEWDAAERGKNNGCLNGVQYFQCDVDGAGSFMKSTNKKISGQRRDFLQALIHQYADEENELVLNQTIAFGTKIAESYGFHKLNKLQADFNNLKSVSLDRKLVFTSFEPNELTLEVLATLKNVEKLDLSYNLVSDINHVWNIVDHMPQIKELNLNGNRFYKKSDITTKNHHLLSLKLASTNINLSQFLHPILTKFVSLTELSLAGNKYTDDCLEVDVSPNKLTKLDLSFNELTKLPKLLQSVLSINLEQNQIASIESDVIYDNITSIDLRNNKIADWKTIDKLYTIFPNIRELRINGNPIFDNISVEEMTINLISRFECGGPTNLVRLNGSTLSEEEVQNAELYFISKVRLGDYQYDTSCKRWQLLLEKYHIKIPTLATEVKFQNKLSSKKITLNILSEELNLNYNRVFLIDNLVLKLKGIVSKLLTKSILDLQVHYYINEFEAGQEAQIKQYLDDDLAILDSFGFYPKQNLYVSLTN